MKADLDEVEDLKDLVRQLPRVEEVDQLKKYVSGSIEGFRGDNDTFRSDFKTQNEIIRRYDEVLMHRASIIRVEEMINESTEKLKKNMTQIDSQMASVNT